MDANFWGLLAVASASTFIGFAYGLSAGNPMEGLAAVPPCVEGMDADLRIGFGPLDDEGYSEGMSELRAQGWSVVGDDWQYGSGGWVSAECRRLPHA